jgi:hypothetical protein
VKNKWIIFTLIGLTLIVLITLLVPIMVNQLMYIDGGKVAGDKTTWIGFHGSFIGAIVGGLISGALTLVGVILTINRQRDIDFDNKYPKIVVKGKKIHDEMVFITSVLKLVKQPKNKVGTSGLRTEIEAILNHEDELLEWSAEISKRSYLKTKEFIDKLRNLNYKLRERMISDGGGGWMDDPKWSPDQIVSDYIFFFRDVSNDFEKILVELERKYYKK